ncbi:hypothetical protein [Solimonas terrae]|uniref:Lipocalin family protein n=1 Tax=Solimonas terrae TaxID=1396819 RepID=A0A6M2BW41_9GAMM|nr:hypothetical protein [Solimonas terrae]NGY06614.1 hypothetical protein [Solimonas terrae]
MKIGHTTLLIGALLAIAACKPSAPASAVAPPAAPAKAIASSSFSDRVWRVSASSTIEPGMLYVFLSDGTLVIAAGGSTPTLGKWRYENGALTMIEEGNAYPTDIVSLGDNRFTIRSHNPGTPVEITLERAAP